MHRRGQRGLEGSTFPLIFELCVQAASMLIKSYILPLSHQIGIRTVVTVRPNFMRSENYICTLFENRAGSNLKKIFSVRANNMLQF